MKVVRGSEFRAERAWGALDLAVIDGASVRLHWTDEPYRWHRNDGVEVFAVVHGVVEVSYRSHTGPQVVELRAGDMFVAEEADEHSARPVGEARVLVVERQGSV